MSAVDDSSFVKFTTLPCHASCLTASAFAARAFSPVMQATGNHGFPRPLVFHLILLDLRVAPRPHVGKQLFGVINFGGSHSALLVPRDGNQGKDDDRSELLNLRLPHSYTTTRRGDLCGGVGARMCQCKKCLVDLRAQCNLSTGVEAYRAFLANRST